MELGTIVKVKRFFASFTIIIATILVVALILWFCVFITDYVRFKQNKSPLFVFDTTNTGTIDEYKLENTCLLYKYVEEYTNGNLTKRMYLFNILELK